MSCVSFSVLFFLSSSVSLDVCVWLAYLSFSPISLSFSPLLQLFFFFFFCFLVGFGGGGKEGEKKSFIN